MAKIDIQPDHVDRGTWWLIWVERGEVVGRVLQDRNGRCQIAPQGPHWSPMKSFGGQFEGLDSALAEVSLYFKQR